MGAWSHEPFGNDTACDWAYDLESITDYSLITDTLQQVIDEADEYIDADVASEAIAAIEVLAKTLGKGTQSDSYTENVEAWVKDMATQPSAELLQLALTVLEVVQQENSELNDLWAETEENYTPWINTLNQLKQQLIEE
jgi:hemerythrin superfamily protein